MSGFLFRLLSSVGKEGYQKEYGSGVSTNDQRRRNTKPTREIIVTGLKANTTSLAGHACYYDRRHNRKGEAKYPENMKSLSDADAPNVKLTLVDCDVGDNPLVAESHAYVDQSTNDDFEGRETKAYRTNGQTFPRGGQNGMANGVDLIHISWLVALFAVFLYVLSKIVT